MICGIDCGVNGALALFDADGTLLDAVDMPSASERVGKTQRTRVSLEGLRALLLDWRPSHAGYEKVAPRPGDTPMTGYLLMAYGEVRGVIAGLGIPSTPVNTREWRNAAGIKLRTGMSYQDRKEASRIRALQLYPAQAALFARKRDSDRAEAVLVGRWLLARGNFA